MILKKSVIFILLCRGEINSGLLCCRVVVCDCSTIVTPKKSPLSCNFSSRVSGDRIIGGPAREGGGGSMSPV